MRAWFMIALVPLLLLAACGDDDGLVTTSGDGDSWATTTGGEVTSTEGVTTTGGVTTTLAPGGESGWARVPDAEGVFSVSDPSWMSSAIHGVTPGGPGLVAVGLDFPHLDWAGMGGVWTSPDGVAWSKSPWDPQVAMGILDAVASGPLGLVAVGSEYNGADYDAVAWTSPDGVVWSRASDPAGVLGGPGWQGMHAAVAGGPGWVAVGYDDSGEDWNAAVWTSVDGDSWARVPHDEGLFGGENDQEMFAVAAGGPGWVAVGADDESPAAWASADGLNWQKMPGDRFSADPRLAEADMVLRAVLAGAEGLVAAGSTDPWSDASEETEAGVWVGATDSGLALVSEDAATFGGAGSQRITALTLGPGGILVAVGWDDSGGDADAAVWTSPDGINWSRVLAPAVFGGGGDQEMLGVAVVGSRLVAVGRDGVGAAVWVSPPG